MKSGPGQAKKVLILVTKSGWGGAQRYVFDLATNLPTGLEPVVAFGPAPSSAEAGPLATRLHEHGVRTILIPELGRDIGLADVAAFRAIRRVLATEKPDIVHLNSSKVGALGALAARLEKTPRIIFTAHGWPFREQRNLPWRLIAWIGSAATVALSHAVICVSESDCRAFGSFFPNRLVTIHNAVGPTPLHTREGARSFLDLSHDENIVIGSVAELTFNKGIDLGLKALARARERGGRIFYYVIGEGEEKERLLQLVQELKLNGAVRFLGQSQETREEAAKFMRGFDAMLIPSRKEGLPYVLLEAHAAGVPVIASRIGGIPEIALPSDILCTLGDIGAFADALLNVKPLTGPSEPKSNSDFQTMLEKTFTLY